ncbi:alanine--tRNA ligase [Candidatus Micrarchaeota archaeon CG08_land_8_20_14_0_20_59_11]|nr:MAG: alanine--tRNA ligase [Candidatus Micrarchaeota archaeon CG08_land_8_20_14_0_20_59_11]
MASKDELRKEFSKDYKRHYEVPLFGKEGFSRFTCKKCGKGYWALEEGQDCGDSAHREYSFFREKPRVMGYADFWKKFADFWKKNGHSVIPRYPVLSRWRDDLYFTIASIVDFQRLEAGRIVFEYPENPLMVPQICLRFPDIANIGVTGRHLSSFMMAGQHSFGRNGYWREKCIELNYGCLRDVLGIDRKKLTYTEDVWNMPDFSAFGPCIETFADGSELVNSVFMQYYLDGGQKKELPTRVIDVGWGFERLLWYYTGARTIYDASFPREIEFMKSGAGIRETPLFARYAALSSGLDVESVHDLREEREKIAKKLGITLREMEDTIAPMQGVYAIADHSRTLLFALTDGALPSNTAGGYNLRVLARRAFSFMNEYGFDFDLMRVMEMHAADLKPLFPELSEGLDSAQKIMGEEKRKYAESMVKAKRIAGEIVAKGGEIDADNMASLYESNGVTPEILEKAAATAGKTLRVSTEFYGKLTNKHIMEEKGGTGITTEAPATKLLYYETEKLDGEAKVVATGKDWVALDGTLFYPEGGGQTADHGWIDGAAVTDAQKKGGVVMHHVGAHTFKKGQNVKMRVDAERRQAIRRHHSATHVLIQSARRLLGRHVWQCGSKKEEDIAHVDITHYRKLSNEEKAAIEELANRTVLEGRKITSREMDRGEAERKYGFRLYQGGGAIGRRIRIVEIDGFDVQACGGLHCNSTQEIGLAKIVQSEQVQDGVVRLYFKTGLAALAQFQSDERIIEEARGVIGVHRDELPKTVGRFFEEWKRRGKEIEKLSGENALLKAKEYAVEAKGGTVKKTIAAAQEVAQKLAIAIAKEGADAVIITEEGFVFAATHAKSKNDAVALLKETGAVGGGKRDFARGKLKA